MIADVWLVFAAAYLVTTLSPGPNVLLVLKNSVTYGWQSAFVTIAGNLICQLMIVILVALGIGTLIAQSPPVFMVLKVCGAGYLIFSGIRQIRDGRKKSDGFEESGRIALASKMNPYVILREAFLVSASNPKTIVFLSAFLPQFLNGSEPLAKQFTIMFMTIAGIVSAVHLVYAFSVSRLKQRLSGRKFRKPLSALTGTLFVSLGCGVLFSNR